jgi:hypothetical protein
VAVSPHEQRAEDCARPTALVLTRSGRAGAAEEEVLGWKRTREETIALAEELLAEGRMVSVVAEDLGVGERYLQRLLESPTPRKRPRNASAHAAKVAATCDSDTGLPPCATTTRLRPQTVVVPYQALSRFHSKGTCISGQRS